MSPLGIHRSVTIRATNYGENRQGDVPTKINRRSPQFVHQKRYAFVQYVYCVVKDIEGNGLRDELQLSVVILEIVGEWDSYFLSYEA